MSTPPHSDTRQTRPKRRAPQRWRTGPLRPRRPSRSCRSSSAAMFWALSRTKTSAESCDARRGPRRGRSPGGVGFCGPVGSASISGKERPGGLLLDSGMTLATWLGEAFFLAFFWFHPCWERDVRIVFVVGCLILLVKGSCHWTGLNLVFQGANKQMEVCILQGN